MRHNIKIFGLVILCFVSEVMAEPLGLKKIMQGLNIDMQRVVDGVAREDWYQVTDAAQKIAHHPAPPKSEKKRIKAFMGANMAQFKAKDMKTHHAASELYKAALSEDGNKIIAAFAELQSSCLSCHQAYRESFRKYFKTP